MLMGLLSYVEEQLLKKYSQPYEYSREKFPLKIALVSESKLKICT
jgi:hypothetical protein